MRYALPLIIALAVFSGCSFAFYESEVAVIPHAMPIVASTQPVEPQSLEQVALISEFIKLIDVTALFTGEGKVKQAAISGNAANGVGVEYRTKRRFLVFDSD